MVNEIKLDGIGQHYFVEHKAAQNKSTYVDNQKESVTVSNHLNELIKSINEYDEPIHHSELSDIQYRIQHNEYSIDFDRLSEKLLTSGII